MGIYPKINKHGGSNNHVGGRIPQKLINVEVLIRHVVEKNSMLIREFRVFDKNFNFMFKFKQKLIAFFSCL